MDTLTRRDALLAAGIGGGAFALSPAFAAVPGPPCAPSWKKLVTVPYKGKQDDIHFVSPDIGWYGNGEGKLYGTRDGGTTWTKLFEKPGTFIRALGFIDDKIGFLGNVGIDYYPGVTDKQPLYRTDDGGVTWTAISAPGIEAVAGICGIDILPQKRVFQGEAVTNHIIHAAGRVGGPAMILRSLDSGKTWAVLDLSKHAGMILDVKFFDANNGFVCAATKSDLAEGEALILRTADGGKNWTPAYTSGRKLENCWKMNWPSRKIGYATVQSYNDEPTNTKRVIIKTVDGGKTWKELPLITAPGVQQFGIGFVDEKRGWVGCRAGGYETRDGGKSWSPVEFGKAVNKIRIVRSGGLTRAFAIGVNVHRLDL
jgi:photosystem II stability/assembly factor-like uncharacterized protein